LVVARERVYELKDSSIARNIGLNDVETNNNDDDNDGEGEN
jgi:hypothetical protein